MTGTPFVDEVKLAIAEEIARILSHKLPGHVEVSPCDDGCVEITVASVTTIVALIIDIARLTGHGKIETCQLNIICHPVVLAWVEVQAGGIQNILDPWDIDYCLSPMPDAPAQLPL